jgi:hypothetical protein
VNGGKPIEIRIRNCHVAEASAVVAAACLVSALLYRVNLRSHIVIAFRRRKTASMKSAYPQSPQFTFPGKLFCFTRVFVFSERAQCKAATISRGGQCKKACSNSP